ncbi:TMV resistance protein N-like [Vitis riparia]|uniref:TMV resistance protein N-like n=1 Tax=Vitis riparia TaxID=96939 RepID=UPI00155AEF82|nr:TMV resistance protein N-like [Vitis riparia]
MCDLKSLETFILSGCSRLEDFPENFGNLEMLKELHADGIPVRVLPSSFSLLRNLEILSFKGCRGPPSTSWLLPRRSSSSTGSILHHLSGLYSLTRLNLGYCNLSDETNLSSLCLLSSLEVLDLSGNNFVTLPNIRGLSSLEGLLLEKCKRLQVLPELPSSIYSLIAQDCISLENASNQVLKSLFPTTKSPKKTFKRNSGAHLIYVMVYGSRIPDWVRYQSSGCEVEADLPPNWYNSNLLGLALSFVTYVFASNVRIPVSYTLRYSTSSYIANRISIRCDKEGVGLDHVWLLYIKLPLFSNWHNGTPINWHEVTHIGVSFGTQVMGWYPPIKRCGFDLVYSNDQDVNPPVIQFSSISSPPLPNKSTVVLKEIHEDEEELSGSGLSNVDGSESDSSDYHTVDEEELTTATAIDRSEDHSC